MQKSVKIRLKFDASASEKPFVHLFATEFGLVFSIYQAEIAPGKGGRMILDLSGDSENIERALQYAADRGVSVSILTKAIHRVTERCVHCGACTAVCTHQALMLDPVSAELTFNNDNCVVCEMCIRSCPAGAIELEMY